MKVTIDHLQTYGEKDAVIVLPDGKELFLMNLNELGSRDQKDQGALIAVPSGWVSEVEVPF